MAWSMTRISGDLQRTESSIELKRTGTKHWFLTLTGNHPDLPQPEAPGAVEKAVRRRFQELLAANDWVRQALVEIEDLEKRRQPHAQAVADAQAKLGDIAAARADPKILQAADLGKKLADLDKQEAATKLIASEAATALNALDPRLATLRGHLQQARQQLAAQAITEVRQAVAAEKAKAQDRVVAAMAKPLDELAEIEARWLALGDAGLATRVLADARELLHE